MKLITLQATLFTVVIGAALVAALACGRSAPADSPASPTPDAAQTSTAQTSPATPVSDGGTASPVPENEFEASLAGDDLAKYRSLPVEFRESLDGLAASAASEYEWATPHEQAVEYLRALPEDTRPVSEVLAQDSRDMLDELSEKNRRAVLLDVYSRVFGGERAVDGEGVGGLEDEFAAVLRMFHQMEFGDGKVNLPSMDEALTAGALAKLDDIAPIIRRAFHLIWRNWRIPGGELDNAVTRLERALLDAPLEPPPLQEAGLSQGSLDALDDVPNLSSFVAEYIAADLARTGEWDTVGTEYEGAMFLEGFIARASTPEGSRMFAQGLWPVEDRSPPALLSFLSPADGFWPLWAVPPYFREMQPDDVLMEWPNHEDVLSPEALAKVNSLDVPLRDAFEKYWYGTGPLPNDAHWMARGVITWEHNLLDLPFDTLPSMEELLSVDDLATYRGLSTFGQSMVTETVAYDLLRGSTWWETEDGGQEDANTYHATPEEFLAALKMRASWLVRDVARNAR